MSEADTHSVLSARGTGTGRQLVRSSFALVFFPAALIVAYMVNDRARPAVAWTPGT
jgi:hypothetical protein